MAVKLTEELIKKKLDDMRAVTRSGDDVDEVLTNKLKELYSDDKKVVEFIRAIIEGVETSFAIMVMGGFPASKIMGELSAIVTVALVIMSQCYREASELERLNHMWEKDSGRES